MGNLTHNEQQDLLREVHLKIKKQRLFGIPYLFKKLKISKYTLFFFLVYLVLILKIKTFSYLGENLIFGAYSLLVSGYILSKLGLSYFHEDTRIKRGDYEPTISFGIPAKNEEDNIKETVLRIARSDYPKNKFDIILVNDGSSDNTLAEMLESKKLAEEMGVAVQVVDFKINKGKREGMAECIEKSKKDIIIFIDSDSFVEPDTARELVKYFQEEKMAAVAGHAFVANPDKNFLTKMQTVNYYVGFRAYKATESLFKTVTCCSGCCSAYRRKYLIKVLDEWRNQTFLGVKCTYGDDRSLTNCLLARGYHTAYSSTAKVHTFVPETLKKFMKQQLRWKKSWTRESIRAGKFMWKRHPVSSVLFYLGLILPLIAPIIVVRAFIWYPIRYHAFPFYYLFGLLLMAAIYGMYYYVHNEGGYKWIWGVFFCTFYTFILIWQLPYAILTIRDARWGTR